MSSICSETSSTSNPVCASVCVWWNVLSPTLDSVLESPSRLDEEHRLIARYAARLAAEAGNSTVSISRKTFPLWSTPVRLNLTLKSWLVIVMHFMHSELQRLKGCRLLHSQSQTHSFIMRNEERGGNFISSSVFLTWFSFWKHDEIGNQAFSTVEL